MPIYELAALSAATLWALTSIISTEPSRFLGAIGFNTIRMWAVFIILGAYTLWSGDWRGVDPQFWPAIVLSGLIGIFLGDTALFTTMNRLGPRRTAMLFSLNAPFSVLLGWIILGEALSFTALSGIALVILGVFLAIAYGKRRSQIHQWESVKGPLVIGVMTGITAALCQSAGSLIARPIMESGADPIAVSVARVGVAALCLSIMMQLPNKNFKLKNPLNIKVVSIVAISGFIGMGIGMTLLLFALSGGELGIVATLSATTPAILLPLLWIRTREMPAPGAWVGAGLVVVGSGLIFSVN